KTRLFPSGLAFWPVRRIVLVLPGASWTVSSSKASYISSAQALKSILSFQVVGRPSLYATHQEIKVKEGDLA
ncbi:hypothetical protein VPJ68_16545, partial [Parabacteroides distasonis]